MTIAEVNENIKTIATMHGFKTERTNYSEFLEIKSEEVNFMFSFFDAGSDWKALIERKGVTLQVSVRKMGGQPTVDELLASASEIQRAALVMKLFNQMQIVIEKHYGKEDA